jgi:hypothetical protein
VIFTYQSEFAASTREIAAAKATERWRKFLGDPEAELPWDASIDIKGNQATLYVRMDERTMKK